LYGFVGNDGVDYTDVVGLWERDYNWTGKRGKYSGSVRAEKNDTWKGLFDLVLLKSGDFKLNLAETALVPGKHYPIDEILVELERQTRVATVQAATKFELKFEQTLVPWIRTKSIGMAAAFVKTENPIGVGCLPATAYVMAIGGVRHNWSF
jgi:hypothetical protein